eukprot:11299275-Ditylum_brightwellii.AAC.1
MERMKDFLSQSVTVTFKQLSVKLGDKTHDLHYLELILAQPSSQQSSIASLEKKQSVALWPHTIRNRIQ